MSPKHRRWFWKWLTVSQWSLKNQEITQVSWYKYLGVHIDNLLCWKTHIDNLCSRLSICVEQRLYFLRRLRLYGVSSHIMMTFYRAIVESLIWFGNLTVKLKSKLAGMHKTATKIVGRTEYGPIQNMQLGKKQRQYSATPNTHSSLNMKPCHQGEESESRYANVTALNYHLSQPPLSWWTMCNRIMCNK